MSVLQLPRLYFNGEISWDPGLANNNRKLFDPVNVRLLNSSLSAEDAKKNIIDNLEQYGIWNYYGTHHAIFENVQLTGGSLSYDNLIDQDDPLIGQKLSLKGMLVDIDAAAVNGSQLFYDKLDLGDATIGITGTQNKPIHARWINFSRNKNFDGKLIIAGVASVVWQTEIETSKINFRGANNSPLLKGFESSLAEDSSNGIMLRFHTYRTLYYQNGILNNTAQQPRNEVDLKNLYLSGINFSNPAYSKLVGVMGVWRKDDYTSLPGKRIIYSVNGIELGDTDEDGNKIPTMLGPCSVETNTEKKILSIDLGATIPEVDSNLTKAEIKDLKLQLKDNGQLIDIATIKPDDYGQLSYENKCGIIDLDLSNHVHPSILNKVNECSLSIRQIQSNILLQEEMPIIAFVSQRDVYMDEDESKVMVCNVFNKGLFVNSDFSVLVCEYDRSNNFKKEIGSYPCDSKGTVEYNLKAVTPGFSVFLFMPYKGVKPTPPQKLNPILHSYINVRTLPFDNSLEKATPDSKLTWSFVYEEIFKVYDVLNPVMSRSGIDVPLNNRIRMESLVAQLKRVLSKKMFNSFMHMPVTRDMSAGKRKLLERWCTLVENGENPEDDDLNLIAMDTPKDPRTLL